MAWMKDRTGKFATVIIIVITVFLVGFFIWYLNAEIERDKKADFLEGWLKNRGYCITYDGCIYNPDLPESDFSFSFSMWYLVLEHNCLTKLIFRFHTTFLFYNHEYGGYNTFDTAAYPYDLKELLE